MIGFDKIQNALRKALADAGVTGELQITMGGMASTSWLGPPRSDDLLVRVDVSGLDDETSPHADPDAPIRSNVKERT